MPGSGGGIRTPDLRVMSPTSYHCSTPRRWPWWTFALKSDETRIDSWRASIEAKPSTISTPQLNALPRLHLAPIKQVVFLWS